MPCRGLDGAGVHAPSWSRVLGQGFRGGWCAWASLQTLEASVCEGGASRHVSYTSAQHPAVMPLGNLCKRTSHTSQNLNDE